MKSPERLKDFIDGSPAPNPPLEFSTEILQGQKWVWFNGGWWLPSTLPPAAYYEHKRREYERDQAAMSTPRP